VVDDLDDTIREIRSVIFSLQADTRDSGGVRADVLRIVDNEREALGFEPRIRFDGPVDAIGFSMGAMTLLELAINSPERFGRLVVAGIGNNVFVDDEERRQVIIDAVEGRATDDNVGRLFSQYANQPGNDAVALAAIMRRKGERLTKERLAAVTMPVLVALGDKDFAGPADPLVAALPDARLVTLKGVDHFATPESFAFIDAALEFLDALS